MVLARSLAPGAFAAAVCATGCAGDITSSCDTSIATLPPAAPTMVEPAPGRFDVVSDALVLSASAFSDPDPGDTHARSEFEVWAFDGADAIARVWHASVTDPALLTSIALADGSFDAGGGVSSLSDNELYAARVRYGDSTSGCDGWSEWSEYRPFKTDDGSAYLFDPTVVRDIHIGIPPESWGPIDAEATPPDCIPYIRNYYAGSLEFEGETFDGVGVRSKGGCGSARHLDGKAAFKVSLAWDDPAVPGCPDERRVSGAKRLTLNNLVQDHSFLHERMGYLFYAAMGVPAPRAAHARVFVNGELWGLYVHIESIDRRFLSRRWAHFASNDGMMYEGTYWCDLLPQNVPPTLDDSYCLSRKFKDDECDAPAPGGDPLDYTVLQQLVDRIQALPPGGFYPEVEQFFEFQTLLRTWAADAMLAHWDGYAFDIINNYRVYHDPATDRWTLIPTGIDQTFGGGVDPFTVNGILAQRCLDEPDCTAAFGARLHQAADTFEQLGLAARSQEVQALIDPYVAEDPRKEGGYDEYRNLADEMRAFIANRPDEIRNILASRGL